MVEDKELAPMQEFIDKLLGEKNAEQIPKEAASP